MFFYELYNFDKRIKYRLFNVKLAKLSYHNDTRVDTCNN